MDIRLIKNNLQEIQRVKEEGRNWQHSCYFRNILYEVVGRSCGDCSYCLALKNRVIMEWA